MTDIEMLREAARLMRERAEAATPSPWDHGGNDGLVWPQRVGDPVSGSTEPEDAEHIASWHPAVALAVADWLDVHCTDLTSAGGDRFQTDSPGDLEHAVKVAGAFLGVSL